MNNFYVADVVGSGEMNKVIARKSLVRAVALALPMFGLSGAASAAALGLIETHQEDPANVDSALAGTSSVVMSHDAKYLFVAAASDGAVTTFGRDPSTGGLTQSSVAAYRGPTTNFFVRLAGVTRLEIAPDSTQVFAAAWNGAAVVTLGVHLDDGHTNGEGTELPSQPFAVKGARMARTADGKNVYYIFADAPGVRVFERNLDAASNTYGHLHVMTDTYVADSISPEMRDALTKPQDVAVSVDGAHVYVVGRDNSGAGGDLTVLSRDEAGMLSGLEMHKHGATVTGMNDPKAVVVSADGKFVYVASDGAVATFSRAEDGKLTFVEATNYVDASASSLDVLDDAQAMVLSPNGQMVYVGTSTKTLAAFARDVETGKLTATGYVVDGVGGAAIGAVQQLVVSPDGAQLYVASNGNVDGVTVFGTSADVSAVIQDSADSVAPGGKYNYTVTVTNTGLADAANALLEITLPDGVTLTNVEGPAGVECEPETSGWHCHLGTVIAGAEPLVVTAEATAPATEGTITTTVDVTAANADPVADNNRDGLALAVSAGAAAAGPSDPAAESGGGGGGALGFYWLLLGGGIAGAARLRTLKK